MKKGSNHIHMTLLIIVLIVVAAGALGWYLGSMRVAEEQAKRTGGAQKEPPRASLPLHAEKKEEPRATLQHPVNPWEERDLGSK